MILNNNEKFIELNNYILLNCIGRGSYSKVYRTKEKDTGIIYAAKVLIEEIDYTACHQYIDISHEINIISKLNHPSVLKFKGYCPYDFKKRPKPVIITEYASNGTLEKLISTERQSKCSIFNDTQKLIIIYGIASAMKYLHSHNIIHRDLKPANILIDDFLFPKIADFGISKVIQSEYTMNSTIGSIKGTPIYMSPEIWGNAEYSKSSDVYAFSIIVYEIVTNQKPFDCCNFFDILNKIKSGYRPEIKTIIPESYRNLIFQCWNEKPLMRPNFDSIVDRLRNDPGFITETIDKEQYLKYIKYIDDYKITFNQSNSFNCLYEFKMLSNIKSLISIQFNDYFSISQSIIPFNYFNELDEKCKNIVKDVGNDPKKMFLIGKYIFEGQELFQRNAEIGILFLKESIKCGLVESSIYYCKKLIKSDILIQNIKKAKTILEKQIKQKDKGNYYLLHGKIKKN